MFADKSDCRLAGFAVLAMSIYCLCFLTVSDCNAGKHERQGYFAGKLCGREEGCANGAQDGEEPAYWGQSFSGFSLWEVVEEGYGVEMRTLALERILEHFCFEVRASARPSVSQSQGWQSRSR